MLLLDRDKLSNKGGTYNQAYAWERKVACMKFNTNDFNKEFKQGFNIVIRALAPKYFLLLCMLAEKLI